MNIKLRALLEVLAFVAASILGIGLLQLIAEKVGADNLISGLSVIFFFWFIYIGYKIRLANLEIRKNLDKLDESISKIKTKA
jgi:hypothetical protein